MKPFWPLWRLLARILMRGEHLYHPYNDPSIWRGRASVLGAAVYGDGATEEEALAELRAQAAAAVFVRRSLPLELRAQEAR